MEKNGFSVVISTYNRLELLDRSIQSVLQQKCENLEVIVIDDASEDETENLVRTRYPNVRYLRQCTNQGPGPARNRGLAEAVYPLALVLDDDDTLLPGAIERISSIIEQFPENNRYPVLNFARSNGFVPEPYMLISPLHYLNHTLQGDFLPVIQVKKFLENGYQYPNLRIGGENLLWLEIAEKFGIPTWKDIVVQTNTDAPVRLTSYHQQVKRAREYAVLQDLTLERFHHVMNKYSPNTINEKLLGSATYWLLAGDRQMARKKLSKLKSVKAIAAGIGIWFLSFMPLNLSKKLFLLFRKVNSQ